MKEVTKIFMCLLFLVFATTFTNSAQSKEPITQPDLNLAENLHNQSYSIRLDVGLSYHAIRLHEDILGDIPSYNSFTVGEYLGLSISKPISEKHYLGTRIDYQRIEGHTLNSFRAIDYYYQWSDSIKVNSFLGAARYDFRTPAYGYTVGFGMYYRKPTWQNWGFSVELQYMDKLARDKLHPDDPDLPWDAFIDVRAITFGANYYF